MAYINVDPAYFSNVKTLRLVARLGAGAESLPLKLWCHCAAHHPEDGRLRGYEPEEIEALIGWRGEAGKAVEAMAALGFLEKNGDGYYVHDWQEHQGHLAMLKERARIASAARWAKHKDAPSNTPSKPPVPSKPSKPNHPNQPPAGESGIDDPLCRELAAYAAECCDWKDLGSSKVRELVFGYGGVEVAEALEFRASMKPRTRWETAKGKIKNRVGAFVADLKRIASGESLEPEGEYEPFQNWRERRREELP